MRILAVALIVSALVPALVMAQDHIATLRQGPITDALEPPRMSPADNSDIRKVRNYPDQPPLIPHKIDGYQIDLKANKCLTCHSRTAIEVSQAPMISVTHFMDRDGQFLASVSPRRYFCTQCHVPQHEVDDLVPNEFVDIDTLLQQNGQ